MQGKACLLINYNETRGINFLKVPQLIKTEDITYCESHIENKFTYSVKATIKLQKQALSAATGDGARISAEWSLLGPFSLGKMSI